MKNFIPIIFLWFSIEVYADFGQSCSSMPVKADYGRLESINTYGYIKNLMDMKKYVPSSKGCDDGTNTLTVCVMVPETVTNSPPCKLQTLKSGDKVKLLNTAQTSLVSNIEFSLEEYKSNICISMPTSQGSLPLMCKKASSTPNDAPVITPSCLLNSSCIDGNKYSRSLFKFSGRAVDCVSASLNQIFYSPLTCNVNQTKESIIPFYAFQEALRQFVVALLIIYIIFFGIGILLEPEKVEPKTIFGTVIKVLIVCYFTIGLGQSNISDTMSNGLTNFALPLLQQFSDSFSLSIFNSGSSTGLCAFNPSDYEPGKGFYALWDSIDCRIAYYQGAQSYDINGKVFSGNAFDKEVFGIYILLGLMLAGGNIMLLIMTIIFIVMFLSMMLFFISYYLVCIFVMHLLAYIGPLFIPLSLFERTSGYFKAWLKIFVSTAIQPIILISFITIILNLYDSILYEGCTFNKETYNNTDYFNLVTENVSSKCKSGMGYSFYEIFALEKDVTTENFLIFETKVWRNYGVAFSLGLLKLTIFSWIFYFFSQSIAQFAADLTGSIALTSISPIAVINRVGQGLQNSYKFMKAASRRGKGEEGGAGKPPQGKRDSISR